MIVFVCAVFTLVALYYVFFFPGEVYAGDEKTRLGYLRERKEAVYENLRDLNFEYKAGKVPDLDYESMRASLEEEAAAIMARSRGWSRLPARWRDRLFTNFVCLLLLSLAAAAPGFAQQWHDASKHTVQFVTVEDGVRLEVLDSGGSGRPIVLLAGLGMTAHVFDGFAEKLAGSYRVYGITRRGYGASSRPSSGYSEQRRAEDDLEVVDALKLVMPVIAGHSIAGDELTQLGNQYSEGLPPENSGQQS